MTSQSPRIYTYKITFEEVPYYYYGSKKEKAFDEDLAWEYNCNLYYDCNEDEESVPIVEEFTSELLIELENLVYQLDN